MASVGHGPALLSMEANGGFGSNPVPCSWPGERQVSPLNPTAVHPCIVVKSAAVGGKRRAGAKFSGVLAAGRIFPVTGLPAHRRRRLRTARIFAYDCRGCGLLAVVTPSEGARPADAA